MAKQTKLSDLGQVDARTHFQQLIDDYFGKGGMDADLDSLTPEKRLTIMAKYAEFRWGKKTAESEDSQNSVDSVGELINAVYARMEEGE